MSAEKLSVGEHQHRRATWLSVSDVAARCGGVTNGQVIAWVDAGELRAWRAELPGSKRRELRFKPEWVAEFERKRTVNGQAA